MDTLIKAVPEHLLSLNWFELEEARALSIFEELKVELKSLKKKLNNKRVHQARVVIRRWYSIWEILEADNWQDKRYVKKIGTPLSLINKELGRVRDLDVNIDLAEDFQAPLELLAAWRKKRNKRALAAEKRIKKLSAGKIAKDLAEHLSRRAYELERLLVPLPEDQESEGPSVSRPFQSPLEEASYHHIDRFLNDCEDEARELASRKLDAEELHELRLIIKRWRYLLTEFFSVTNLELVRAQQLLGRHHDLIRLRQAIEKYSQKTEGQGGNTKNSQDCQNRITLELARLEDEITRVKQELPYGLRPYMVSTLIG